MKKFKTFISLFLIIATFVLTVLPASATSYTGVNLSSASGKTASTCGISMPIKSLSKKAYMILQLEYNVVSGKTVLHINSCSWSPLSKNISIGFYASDASGIYKSYFSGGSISNFDIYTDNVPSGEYWVFLYNEGDESITGAIDFYIYETA